MRNLLCYRINRMRVRKICAEKNDIIVDAVLAERVNALYIV